MDKGATITNESVSLDAMLVKLFYLYSLNLVRLMPALRSQVSCLVRPKSNVAGHSYSRSLAYILPPF